MTNATETQAGGMDPDFTKKGHGILVRQSCKLGAVSQIQKEEREEEREKHTPKTRKRLHLVHQKSGNECLRIPPYRVADEILTSRRESKIETRQIDNAMEGMAPQILDVE